MTSVGKLSKVKLPTTSKVKNDEVPSRGKGGGEIKVMEGKSTGIVEKGWR